MNKFIFRVESGNQTGMGHFYRCLALANILDGYQRTFLMNDYKPHLESILNSSNINLEVLNSDTPFIANDNELLTYIDKKDIVILDGYQFDECYMKEIYNTVAGLVVIDDLNHGNYVADVILNHGPQAKNIKYNCIKNTKLLLGEQYTLLRPAFYRNAGTGKVRNRIEEITICFGGTDPNNFASKYLEAFHNMEKKFQINVILGASNHNQVNKYEKFNHNLIEVKTYRNISDDEIAMLLLASDLLIAPSSNIMMEACTLNIPAITQTVAENQKPFYEFLYKNQLAICIPDYSEITASSLTELLNSTIFDKSLRENMIANQKKIFDGKSNKRLKNEFEILAANCGLRKEPVKHTMV